METNSDPDTKTPLLNVRRHRRIGSFNSLRSDFISRLPNKVLSGIDVDVETSFKIDTSKMKALTQGVSPCVFFFSFFLCFDMSSLLS